MAAKKAAKKPAGKNPRIDNGYSPANRKAAKDARGRATKYGTPTGPTSVTVDSVKKNRIGSAIEMGLTMRTPVKSQRGNMYAVSETKTQRFMAKDSKPKTVVRPMTSNFTKGKKTATNQPKKRTWYK